MMYFFLGAGIDTAFPVGGGAVGGGGVNIQISHNWGKNCMKL